MANRKEKPDITLESLLRLKRDERPGGEFWNTFERDFQRRRLNSLVEKSTYRDIFWAPGIRALAVGLPALLLLALTVLWTPGKVVSNNSSELAMEPAPALDTGMPDRVEPKSLKQNEALPDIRTSLASSQFVVDAIEDGPSSGMNLRKVLYTPAIRLSAPTGAFYVRDSMSSSNYRVTTADMKLGRNF